jgi:hypothetical protein
MTISEILVVDFDPEIANTRRTLERIPENDPQWKPHDKSMPIGRLAMHVARLPQFLTLILTTPELDLAKAKFPSLVFESTAHLLSELDRSAAEANSHLLATSDDELKKNWKLSFGDKVVAEGTRLLLYRTMFLNHLVHQSRSVGRLPSLAGCSSSWSLRSIGGRTALVFLSHGQQRLKMRRFGRTEARPQASSGIARARD